MVSWQIWDIQSKSLSHTSLTRTETVVSRVQVSASEGCSTNYKNVARTAPGGSSERKIPPSGQLRVLFQAHFTPTTLDSIRYPGIGYIF